MTSVTTPRTRPQAVLAATAALAICWVLVALVVAAQGQATSLDLLYRGLRLAAGTVALAAARGLAAPVPFGARNLGRGLLLGLPIVGVAGLALVGGSYPHFRGPGALAVFTISMIGVGWFEEAVTRGLLLGVMLRAFPASRTGRLLAVVVSSLAFGLGHLVNLGHLGGVGTAVQVGYATLIGIGIAALRLRTGSLLVPVLLHALLDWAFYLGTDVFGAAPAAGKPVVLPLVLGALVAGCGLFQLRHTGGES